MFLKSPQPMTYPSRALKVRGRGTPRGCHNLQPGTMTGLQNPAHEAQLGGAGHKGSCVLGAAWSRQDEAAGGTPTAQWRWSGCSNGHPHPRLLRKRCLKGGFNRPREGALVWELASPLPYPTVGPWRSHPSRESNSLPKARPHTPRPAFPGPAEGERLGWARRIYKGGRCLRPWLWQGRSRYTAPE